MSVFLLSLSFLLPLIVHPLILGVLILLIRSLGRVVLSSLVISWFGYRLFLVYVGGILVMFSYVVALSPNFRGISYSYFIFIFFGSFVLSFLFLSVLDSDLYWSFSKEINIGLFSSSSVTGLYSDMNVSIMVFLLIMLLATMVMVVKICYYRSGPLRPFS